MRNPITALPQSTIVALLPVAAIVVVLTELMGIIPKVGFNAFHLVSYGLRIALLVGLVAVSPTLKVNRWLLLFGALMLSSSLLSGASTCYESLKQSVLYIVSIALVSPLISSPLLDKFRGQYWKWLLILLTIFMLPNFGLYVYERLSYSDFSVFDGLFKHQNELSISAAIVSLLLTWTLLRCAASPEHLSVKRKILRVCVPYILLIMTLMLTIVAGSRASLASLALGLLPVFTLAGVKRSRWIHVVIGSMIAIAVIMLQYDSLFRSFKFKVAKGVERESITYSRDELWEARWLEFRDHPLTGIGFGVATHFSATFDHPDEDGNLTKSEAGSSWLRLLSNLGIFGFAVFVAFNVKLCVIMLRNVSSRHTVGSDGLYKPNSPPVGLYFGLWVMLMVHGCFDGWIEYVRGVEFFIYWLLTWHICSLPVQSPDKKLNKKS